MSYTDPCGDPRGAGTADPWSCESEPTKYYWLCLCSECGAKIAEIDDDEYDSLAAEDMSVRPEVSGSERVKERVVRDLSYYQAGWDAHSLLNHLAFGLLFGEDFKTDLAKHDAYQILVNARRHVIGLHSSVDK